jgi:para-nitrobenzyl esterase
MKANRVLGATAPSATSVGIDRRAFLRASSAAVAGVAGGALLAGGPAVLAQGTTAPEQSGYSTTGTQSIARTRYGRVQGVHNGKAHVFKGIPYGAPATGDNRFMPPREPQPWSGIREWCRWTTRPSARTACI